ncbi:type II toxin-antitoxin system HicB family antitoxin [Candidatus Thiosymbion oneisti]|uniref:type II toxin-antitoxin system HicB family antitoxin n=1 Tax=Candidatus Thiosymbion oneisti TaxID=589554 RepID=UPI00105E4E4F|nr:type II toxin-antitoxin system HicB family antitoxin [Candidatus Thiosymbion oneisti]
MLVEYLQTSLRHAHYEILEEDKSFYGEIPGFQGVYANAPTLEECHKQLKEVLEEWVLFRIYKNLPLPQIDGIEIKIRKVA